MPAAIKFYQDYYALSACFLLICLPEIIFFNIIEVYYMAIIKNMGAQYRVSLKFIKNLTF